MLAELGRPALAGRADSRSRAPRAAPSPRSPARDRAPRPAATAWSRPSDAGSSVSERRCATHAYASSASTCRAAASSASRAGARRPRAKLLGLVGKRAATTLELEQDALAGLSSEPDIATVGVVAHAVRGDRDALLDLEELRALDEPDSVEEAHRVVGSGDDRDERACAGDGSGDVPSARGGDDDGEVAETTCSCPFDQVERVPVVGGEQRRGAPRERRCDGRLVAGLYLEGREREPLAFLGERARGGRDALPLGQRVLERREPLARRARPLGQVVPLA